MLDFTNEDNVNIPQHKMTPEQKLCNRVERLFTYAACASFDRIHSQAYLCAAYILKFAQESGADMDKFQELFDGTFA